MILRSAAPPTHVLCRRTFILRLETILTPAGQSVRFQRRRRRDACRMSASKSPPSYLQDQAPDIAGALSMASIVFPSTTIASSGSARMNV